MGTRYLCSDGKAGDAPGLEAGGCWALQRTPRQRHCLGTQCNGIMCAVDVNCDVAGCPDGLRSNPHIRPRRRGPENIWWVAAGGSPPSGTYHVCGVLRDHSGTPPPPGGAASAGAPPPPASAAPLVVTAAAVGAEAGLDVSASRELPVSGWGPGDDAACDPSSRGYITSFNWWVGMAECRGTRGTLLVWDLAPRYKAGFRWCVSRQGGTMWLALLGKGSLGWKVGFQQVSSAAW